MTMVPEENKVLLEHVATFMEAPGDAAAANILLEFLSGPAKLYVYADRKTKTLIQRILKRPCHPKAPAHPHTAHASTHTDPMAVQPESAPHSPQ